VRHAGPTVHDGSWAELIVLPEDISIARAPASVMATPSVENLERIARLLDDGVLRVPIQRSFALDQAGEALAALGSHKQGKLGLSLA
jgi:NADPH:quinone reductase-like Zn-dependent oxidoreductase